MPSHYHRIGLHVSAAGGVENAPENAKSFDAEVFQFFSRSPRGGQAPKFSEEQVTAFRARCRRYGFESYIHTPYYINFASKKKALAAAAPRIVREELERASLLGVKYVVTHLGSAKDWVDNTPQHISNNALNQTIIGLKNIFKGDPDFSAKLLLELSAGAGAVIGNTFEELAYILKGLDRSDVHICLDTCHLFASGYDIRTRDGWNQTLQQFRRTLGITRLKLIHANDSKTGLGGHIDRHEHLGKGKLGLECFHVLFQHPDLAHVNFILETPHDTMIQNDITLLKRYRKQES